ncbi:MAG: hypothetical protein HS113_24135 [Verrucomicrobiales bacterium]|nr:hypothetical protein [Verrucomicrobiales bacterium]
MLSRKKLAVLTLAAIAGAAIIVTQTAGSKGRAYKLEGAWTLASEDGLLGCLNLVPSDPSGHEATAQAHWVSAGQAGAFLLAAYGADALSDTAMVAKMISRDTARYTDVYYAIKTGLPNEIKGIAICSGTWTFAGRDRLVLSGTTSVYFPSRDADGDGLPDDLENPPDVGPFPHVLVGTRVPLLP